MSNNNHHLLLNQETHDLLNKKLTEAYPDEILQWGVETFGSKIVLGTGFGSSGMFLIHRIYQLGLPITVFFLDTHLLFEETYALKEQIEQRYDMQITRVTPDISLEKQTAEYGEELWNKDPDQCCYLRKVKPLRNYLSDKAAWITGVRRTQAKTRQQTKVIERDPENGVIKINPLANWSSDQVWDYIHINELPYNPLHDQGYPSIGCIPCTQPVGSKEDERAGRWQGAAKTECGIHVSSQKYQQQVQE